MGIIEILVVGALVGWLAAAIMGRREGILGSMGIGIVGAAIGSVLSSVITGASNTYLAFSLSGILWSFIGALILSALLNAFQRRGHHTGI